MQKINWSDVEPSADNNGSKKLVPGAYICRIVSVEAHEENPDKPYLVVYTDIAEGEFKDYGVEKQEATGYDTYYPHFRAYYSEKSRGIFSRFLHCIEDSNPSFKVAAFDGNEQKLVGKLIGLVLDEAEYQDRRYCKADVTRTYSVKAIRTGKFKAAVMLSSPAVTETKTDDELPF